MKLPAGRIRCFTDATSNASGLSLDWPFATATTSPPQTVSDTAISNSSFTKVGVSAMSLATVASILTIDTGARYWPSVTWQVQNIKGSVRPRRSEFNSGRFSVAQGQAPGKALSGPHRDGRLRWGRVGVLTQFSLIESWGRIRLDM